VTKVKAYEFKEQLQAKCQQVQKARSTMASQRSTKSVTACTELSSSTSLNSYETIQQNGTSVVSFGACRPLQRARCQDDYLLFHPEADPIEVGQIRLNPSHAPYLSKDTREPVHALEEAPDGFRFLDWSGQGLTELPRIGDCFRNARVANISDNKFAALPAQITALALLQKLNISNNSVSSIPDHVGRLIFLRELRASDNSIELLSAKALQKLASLAFLDLRRNQLQELPTSLATCKCLVKLFVSKNRLRQLPSTFTRLLSLQVLHADCNSMDQLGFQAQQLSRLAQLRLGHNQLRDQGLPHHIGLAPALTELALSHNQLETLPESLAKTPLRKLLLEGNPLQRPPMHVVLKGVPHVQRYLASLEHARSTAKLELCRFSLTNCPLPGGARVLAREENLWAMLTSLCLEGNSLVELTVEISILTNLEVLDLQYNRIAVLPPTMGSLYALQVLDVASNLLQSLPACLRSCSRLAELLLENNRFTVVPEVVGHMGALRELRMASNRLTQVPSLLSSLTALTHLDIEHNRIQGQLPACLTSLCLLSTLKIAHNHMTLLPEDLTVLRFASSDLAFANVFSRRQTVAEARRHHMVIVLNGGPRPSYRDTKRHLAPLLCIGQRPPGAGDRRGWDLVPPAT
jgi:Leucine-rich repeat (LRR) protein